ncbi:MAG: hypothetical protein IPM38_15635 [Ignavibacteria bacterium]|nr:hypothetical protein [Ignavibacteria bacterium]
MNLLTKRKEKRSKKEKKNDSSKDKILECQPLRSQYFVFAAENQELFFCKLFLGRDIVNSCY